MAYLRPICLPAAGDSENPNEAGPQAPEGPVDDRLPAGSWNDQAPQPRPRARERGTEGRSRSRRRQRLPSPRPAPRRRHAGIPAPPQRAAPPPPAPARAPAPGEPGRTQFLQELQQRKTKEKALAAKLQEARCQHVAKEIAVIFEGRKKSEMPVQGQTLVGAYAVCDVHDGAPVYKKIHQPADGLDVVLYFWAGRGKDADTGWWFAPSVGSDTFWAHHPLMGPKKSPPLFGWTLYLEEGSTLEGRDFKIRPLGGGK